MTVIRPPASAGDPSGDVRAVHRLLKGLGVACSLRTLKRAAEAVGLTRSQRLLAIWAHGRLIERREPPLGEDALVALIGETLEGTVTEAHDAEAGAPLCRYPSHRASDWRGEHGRLVCGVCHPRPSVR
jgi:hypothetical protein